MFAWLRKKLRKWLLDPEEKPIEDSPFLNYICKSNEKGIEIPVRVVGVAGMYLQVVSANRPSEERLVTEYEVTDSAKWRRLWNLFQKGSTFEWE